jgi:type IV pilus assembly protein PilA
MLLQNLRAKIGARLNAKSEEGFTLIELLVVMLILGILAAIALPAFFNQQDKAGDAEAKSQARTAQTAMETYATDIGSYAGAERSDLEDIEPTIADIPADALTVTPEGDDFDAYTITVVSDTNNTFSIARGAGGDLTFACSAVNGDNRGGCPTGDVWD